MPSRPPETQFYEDPDNETLWRDVSRLYEDFLGGKESEWPKRRASFETVLNDVLVQLRETEKR